MAAAVFLRRCENLRLAPSISARFHGHFILASRRPGRMWGMDTAQPPQISAPVIPGVPSETTRRRSVVTLKLLFIVALVLLLQLPLGLINTLRQERSSNRAEANARIAARGEGEGGHGRPESAGAGETRAYNPAVAAA